MSSSTLRNALPAADAHRGSPMSFIAMGSALTSTLVGLFAICYLLSFVWPTAGLAHGWIAVFASQPDNAVRTVIEGTAGSVAAAWIASVLFVPVYNRMVRR